MPKSDVGGGGRFLLLMSREGRCSGLMSGWGKGVPYYVT